MSEKQKVQRTLTNFIKEEIKSDDFNDGLENPHDQFE